MVRDRGLAGPDGLMPGSSSAAPTGLTIEAIVAVESPREFRLHPRDRVVAYTAEAGGARQLFTLPLRGGTRDPGHRVGEGGVRAGTGRRTAVGSPTSVTRSSGSSRPMARGSTRVVAKPGGARQPHWSPDGKRLAFISRRRGWSQVWVIDAPVPRRGRPANEPRAPEPSVVTASGVDVDSFEWAPDGERLAIMARLLTEGS